MHISPLLTLGPNTPSIVFHFSRGYECELDGDAFLLAFHRPHHAVAFCLELQVGVYVGGAVCVQCLTHAYGTK